MTQAWRVECELYEGDTSLIVVADTVTEVERAVLAHFKKSKSNNFEQIRKAEVVGYLVIDKDGEQL